MDAKQTNPDIGRMRPSWSPPLRGGRCGGLDGASRSMICPNVGGSQHGETKDPTEAVARRDLATGDIPSSGRIRLERAGQWDGHRSTSGEAEGPLDGMRRILQRTNKRCHIIDIVRRPRVKTPVKASVKQRPRGPGSRRCDSCGHVISAGDKFCIGCGMPLTGVAPAAAPQKQRLRPKTVAPRMKRQKSKAVSKAVPQKSIVAPPMSPQKQKQYLDNVPDDLRTCPGCKRKIPHGRYITCPHCGYKWSGCKHKDGIIHDLWNCYTYQAWVDSRKNRD